MYKHDNHQVEERTGRSCTYTQRHCSRSALFCFPQLTLLPLLLLPAKEMYTAFLHVHRPHRHTRPVHSMQKSEHGTPMIERSQINTLHPAASPYTEDNRLDCIKQNIKIQAVYRPITQNFTVASYDYFRTTKQNIASDDVTHQ